MSEFDISNLSYYLNQFDELNPQEFEDMVAVMLRCKGWTNVNVTSRTVDKGRDIIGNDQKGRKSYVEVKQHQKKIGRPVIQKLHSIMIAEKGDKGMVVSTSDFSPEAMEYARNLNIKLMNGKKFIETCEYLIRDAPRSDSLCTPINIDGFLKKIYEIFDSNIFTYPQPASTYIQKAKFLPFNYFPNLIVIASVDQDFQNKSGSFYYHMHIPKTPFIFSEEGELLNDKFANVKFEHTIDLKNIEKILSKKEIPFQKKAQPSINRDKLKRYVQRTCTTKRQYRGQNNQVYTRTCKPTLANIEIYQIFKYWQLFTALDIKIDKFTKLRFLIKDNEITGAKCLDYPTKNVSPKEVRMCQTCQALIFKGALKKKSHSCQECGMIICPDCVYQEKSQYWCKNCAEKLKHENISKKKNKEALKALKKEYQNWKKIKKSIKLEFINS